MRSRGSESKGKEGKGQIALEHSLAFGLPIRK